MSITRRCDYACRIIRAAYRSGDTYISIADVAERESIPYSFARSIQHELVKAGLLKTSRGVNGGLALACNPAETTVLDVLESVNGGVSIAECTCAEYPCAHKAECSFNALWRASNALVNSLLASVTLEGLFVQGANHPAIKAALSAVPAPISPTAPKAAE